MTPAVSVILPTYNRAALIGRAMRSVLEQTCPDFELIVVDDGSTDSTRAAIAGFEDARIRYLRLPGNSGPSAARNAGIAQSVGRFFAFQDSDDEWLPTKLALHMQAFEECDADVGVVYSDMERVFSDGRVEYHQSPHIFPNVLLNPATQFYQVCSLGIQSAVIRRECFSVVGTFDESFHALEDMELFVRLSRRYRFQHLRVPLVRYYETHGGVSENVRAKADARARLLETYRAELEQHDAAFVAREESLLRRAASSSYKSL